VSCDVKVRLFRAYCTSFYGCELWDLSGGSLSAFCTAWRKALRRIWNLPYTTHCHLLPLLCNCMLVFDEICKRSLKFLQTCLFHNTTLNRSGAQFSLTDGRNYSPCGRNALLCVQRYQYALSDIVFSISNISVDAVVDRYVSSGISGAQWRESEFLRELTSIKKGKVFPYSLPSVGPGADPGVQAVSPQVT